MFPVFTRRASNTISAILNRKCYYVKIIFLRLHERPYFRNSINLSWDKNTLDTFHKYSKEYKYFILCRRYSTELDQILKSDIVQRKYVPELKILHSIFETSVHYQNSIMPPLKTDVKVSYEEICKLYTTDWSCASALDIYHAIKIISYCYLNGTRFETSLYHKCIQACNNNLSELNNQQLKKLMQHLIVLADDAEKLDNWHLLLKKLNSQCLQRFFPLSFEEMLFIADAFYQLGDSESTYMWRTLRKLISKCAKLSPRHLVQFLFLLTFSKYPQPTINMFEIEHCVEECIPDLSVNEIGIIARGFFMTKKKIINKNLRQYIIIKVHKNIKSIQSNSLALVMKILRYSGCAQNLPEFEDLLKSLNTEVPRLSLKCLIHIAHAFGGIRVYNEELTKTIIEKVKDDIRTTRLKDIERILFAIFAIAPDNDYYQEACHILMNEILTTYQIVRSSEIDKFPLSFIRILTYGISKNIYMPELIQHVLSPQYVQKVYKANIRSITNDLYTLNCSIKIMFPDYTGPFLTAEFCDYFLQKFMCTDDTYNIINNAKFRTEITFICKQNLGIHTCVDYILPHYFVRDVVCGFDEHNNSVEIEPMLSSIPTGTIKYVNTGNLKNIRWYVLCPVSSQARVVGHNGYSGSTYTKLKQLKAIGYSPIVVDEVKWNSTTGQEHKIDYLKNLLFEKQNSQNLLNSNFEHCGTTKD